MVMDYLLNPVICTIYCSKVAMTFVPVIPYAVWAAVFAGRQGERAHERSARQGFLVCFYLWLSLRWPAKVAGGIWLAGGEARDG
jgi:hypothetical protein